MPPHNTDLRPPASPPVAKLIEPFHAFVRAETFSGFFMIACALTALLWANSPWAESYTRFWNIPLTIGIGDTFVLREPIFFWINDGLMALFFFVVGLEIKREVLVGELASPRQAILPITAAAGGMIVPAVFYMLVNAGAEGFRGWGVPMATDIAFALGILALLGNRVPVSLKVLLTALAIVDDIGAVVVIAVFYTATISWMSLAAGGGVLLLLLVCNRLRIRSPLIYSILGVGLWIAMLGSGLHAAVTGVIVAMTIPARTRIDSDEFMHESRSFLTEFKAAGKEGGHILANERQHGAIQALESLCGYVATPLQRMEHIWHAWVTYGIMPIFALANAGVSLEGGLAAVTAHPVALGVMAGLVAGKQIGVTAAVWMLVRLRVAVLPPGVTWRHVYGVGWLAGIGFTMSLFIADLAFETGPLLSVAKIGILSASMIAGAGGWMILRGCAPAKEEEAERTAAS